MDEFGNVRGPWDTSLADQTWADMGYQHDLGMRQFYHTMEFLGIWNFLFRYGPALRDKFRRWLVS